MGEWANEILRVVGIEIDKWSARFVRDGEGYDGFRWNETGEWTVRFSGTGWNGGEFLYTDKIWVAGGQIWHSK